MLLMIILYICFVVITIITVYNEEHKKQTEQENKIHKFDIPKTPVSSPIHTSTYNIKALDDSFADYLMRNKRYSLIPRPGKEDYEFADPGDTFDRYEFDEIPATLKESGKEYQVYADDRLVGTVDDNFFLTEALRHKPKFKVMVFGGKGWEVYYDYDVAKLSQLEDHDYEYVLHVKYDERDL